MTTKKIDILNGGLEVMIKELEQQQKVLQLADEELLQELADFFVKNVKEQADTIETTYERNAVKEKNEITIKNNTAIITNTDQQATYSEYGTGIIGSQNPHPDPRIPWEYDVNQHGEKGWVYPYESINPDGVVSTGYAHTKGLASNPVYMLSGVALRRALPFLVEKYLKKLKGRTFTK